MDGSQWAHVASSSNPADCASRGVIPENYNTSLWIHGPPWLQNKVINYSRGRSLNTTLDIKKNKIQVFSNTLSQEEDIIFSRFSSLTKFTRVIAYCRRFLCFKQKNTFKGGKNLSSLSCEELSEALNSCIKFYQKKYFSQEIEQLKDNGTINKKGQLASFNPFIDATDIIRVGGRLERSSLSEGMKHPIIIPRKCHLTTLLIADAHVKTLHGGPQLMLNFLRSRYWIIDAKNQVKLYVRRCVTCLRYSSKTRHQLMGQLLTSCPDKN